MQAECQTSSQTEDLIEDGPEFLLSVVSISDGLYRTFDFEKLLKLNEFPILIYKYWVNISINRFNQYKFNLVSNEKHIII